MPRYCKENDLWYPTREEQEIIQRNMAAGDVPFIRAVGHNKHIGYGRMIQIIQGIWDKALEE